MEKNIRTDLALEANEQFNRTHKAPNNGIKSEVVKEGDIEITTVDVISQEASDQLGKECGRYVTLALDLPTREITDFEYTSEIMSNVMEKMLPKEAISKGILVIGLGNRYITADSLGAKVVEKTMVTRHFISYAPEDMDQRIQSVSAIAPGVLGVTGIETEELVEAVVKTVQPGAVIAVDALAARTVSRIATTVQISNTGISPGSGVGNKRRGLNQKTLGVPVIAVGSPTVVYASTIIQDALSNYGEDIVPHVDIPEDIAQMVVTPRDIDEVVDDMSKIISLGLNLLIHRGITADEVALFMN